MANNQKKLKAFVRYDGSGRVVASSLILRKNKPRVGRWYEIPEYLCCNGAPSSTTTTTTQGGGGTPTAWIGRMTTDLLSVCDSGSNLWYTAGPVIDGQIVYQDASLTNPYTENGLLISTAGYYYQLNGVGLATLLGPCPEPTTTTTTTVASFRYSLMDGTFTTAEEACAAWNSDISTYTSVYAAESTIGSITTLYTDAALTNSYGGVIPIAYYILGVPGSPPTNPHTGTISMIGAFGSNTSCV